MAKKIDRDKELVFLKLKFSELSPYTSWSQVPGSCMVHILSESDKFDHILDLRKILSYDAVNLLKNRIDFLDRINKKLSVGQWEEVIKKNPKSLEAILAKSKIPFGRLSKTTVACIMHDRPECYYVYRRQFSKYLSKHADLASTAMAMVTTDPPMLDYMISDFKGMMARERDGDYAGVSAILGYMYTMSSKDAKTGIIRSAVDEVKFKNILDTLAPHMKGNAWRELIRRNPDFCERIKDYDALDFSTIRDVLMSAPKKFLRKIPFNTLNAETRQTMMGVRPDLFFQYYTHMEDRNARGLEDIIFQLQFDNEQVNQLKTAAMIRKKINAMPKPAVHKSMALLSEMLRYETERSNIVLFLRMVPKQYSYLLLDDAVLNIARYTSSLVKTSFTCRHLK